MTTPSAATRRIDIRVDLQSEDDTGYVWAFLHRAAHPETIRAGVRLIVGDSGARCVAEVVDVVDGPGDQIVHLRLLSENLREFERLHGAAHA